MKSLIDFCWQENFLIELLDCVMNHGYLRVLVYMHGNGPF